MNIKTDNTKVILLLEQENERLKTEINRLKNWFDFFGVTFEGEDAVCKPSSMDKFRKAQNDKEVAELKTEIERLKQSVRHIGEMTGTCTFDTLREVCSYCQCGKREANDAD